MRIQSLFAKVLVLIVTFMTMASFFSWGAVRVSVLSPAKEVGPGEFVTHVFSVVNDKATADVFSLEIEVPDGWSLLGAPSTLSLAPGEEATLFVTLTVPAGTTSGEYTVTLRAISQSDPTDQDEALAAIGVSPINAVEVLPPSGGSAAPGGEIRYPFIVVNRGNAQDTLQVEAASANGFPTHLSRELLSLAPQERVTVEIRLQVPVDSAPGRDLLTVKAKSTLYPGVSDEATLFTTILPPPPQAVGGTLMEELPARLRCSMTYDVFSEELDSDLTFSVAGGVQAGYFSAYLRASPIFGPEPLEVGYFSMLYRRTPVTYVIGDTYKKLSELLSHSCRGGWVEVDAETYDLVFIGGGAEGETRVGGRLALGPEEANAGMAYWERRDETDQRRVWSLTASSKPFEDWTLSLEGALGIDNTLTSRALFLGSKINTTSYFLNAAAFSVGTHFPGDRSDTAGLSLSQRLRIEDLSLSSSLSHTWDNVIGDPLVATTLTDNLGGNLTVTPHEEGPTLSSTVGFTWERDADLSVENEIDRLFSIAMTETGGEFPYAFSAKLADQIDRVADTHYRIITFSEGVGLSIEDFELFFKLTQEKREDYLTGELLSGGTSISVRFNSRSALHSLRMTLANTEDDYDLSARVDVRLLKDLHVLFDGALGWDRADATPATLCWGVSFDFTFDLPIPVFVTKGRIAGMVFIDANSNGQYDKGEQGLSNLLLALADTQALTGDKGHFRFPPKLPGTYTLQILNLPLEYVPLVSMPLTLSLEATEVTAIQIPVVEGAFIAGRVVVFPEVSPAELYLKGAEKTLAEEEPEQGTGLPNVTVTLSNKQETLHRVTDEDGYYQFDRLLPGHWTLTVRSDQLPRFHYLVQDVFELDLKPGEHLEQVIKVFVKPRPIQIIEEEKLQVEEKEDKK